MSDPRGPRVQPGAEAEVGLCLLLAAADGEISDAELAALTTRVGRLLGDDFPLGELGRLVESEMASIADLGADGYVERLPSRIPGARRAVALRHACEVACADGLSPEEEDLLCAAGRALEVDVATIVGEIGHRKTEYATPDHDHEDPPDERTEIVAARLGAAGWSDPHEPLRAAGIDLGRIGALGLEYRSPASQAVLRVEHHTCDGSLHLHVVDAADVGSDHVLLLPSGREEALLDALVAMQDALTPANAEARVPELLAFGQ